jgi:hypothetical protein
MSAYGTSDDEYAYASSQDEQVAAAWRGAKKELAEGSVAIGAIYETMCERIKACQDVLGCSEDAAYRESLRANACRRDLSCPCFPS